MMSKFGYGYPAGAENDPRAPWNQRDVTECDTCQGNAEDELIEGCERVTGLQIWQCERCAGRERCNGCKAWHYREDLLDGVCLACGENAEVEA